MYSLTVHCRRRNSGGREPCIECALFQENVFSYYRMYSQTIQCVLSPCTAGAGTLVGGSLAVGSARSQTKIRGLALQDAAIHGTGAEQTKLPVLDAAVPQTAAQLCAI